ALKRITGKITRLEPMKALGHTWNGESMESEVLYELTPKGKDVLLVIHHRLPDDKDLKIGVGGGWAAHTGILADQLNGVKPRAFFSTHARLMKEFEATL
ncbi:MAG TPA: ATPase, partial [Burkholderiales bacterium]|nr:ATPase [Burkholderiales bacterium]